MTSPIHHVHPGCLPTLLIQGDKDLLISVETTNSLYGSGRSRIGCCLTFVAFDGACFKGVDFRFAVSATKQFRSRIAFII